ncbi:uncharacterized protein LOC141609004 [Silene latifolia]|uniref:uncharacterized protein LOC141609004 n=1 Tax=Silene latifolia TaxID=37657 RepID=UPI003D76F2C8
MVLFQESTSDEVEEHLHGHGGEELFLREVDYDTLRLSRLAWYAIEGVDRLMRAQPPYFPAETTFQGPGGEELQLRLPEPAVAEVTDVGMEWWLIVLRVTTVSHQALWQMANRWKALAGDLVAREARLSQGTADPTELARVRAELDTARSMIEAQGLGITRRDPELRSREDELRSRDAEIASLRAQLAAAEELYVEIERETLESSPERESEQVVVSALAATPRETGTGPTGGAE